MAKELLHGPKSLYKTSGAGIVEYFDEGARITGSAWVNQYYPQSLNTSYIEIDPNATFYYDFLYSNLTANNQIYIGIERYDADKTATSNNSTIYIVARKDAVENVEKNGIVNLSKDLNGNPTKYIRLRILNQWTGSSATDAVLEIKRLSLLQLDTNEITPSIKKTGIIQATNFRENDLNKAMLFNKEGFETNNFYEI